MKDSRNALSALLADRFEARRVVLTGSGTQALTLAIRAACAATGSSTVGLPGFSCYDIASAAIGADTRIGLYDIDPLTLTPDLPSVERLFESTGAKVLVVAYLYGFPGNWERLQEIASRFGAVLIEDAAQGHGGYWQKRPLGALGGLSVMSFGRGKGWTGSGGGALLLRDGWEKATIPELPNSGSAGKILVGAFAHWLLGRPSIYGLPASLPWLGLGETRYHEPADAVGMHPVSAALAIQVERVSDLEARGRKARAARLTSHLRQQPDLRLVEELPGAEPGYLRLPLRLPRGLNAFRDEKTALRMGVGRSYPSTLDALPQIVDRLVVPAHLPGSASLVDELITLPIHSMLSARDVDRLTELVRDSG